MAWELQSNMHSLIAPSVYKAASASEAGPESQLATWYADQRWEEDGDRSYADWLAEGLDAARIAPESLCHEIADWAIEHESSTTNGGFEVYLDGWTSVPFCTDDESLDWYA